MSHSHNDLHEHFFLIVFFSRISIVVGPVQHVIDRGPTY